MDPTRHQRIKRIFLEVIALEPERQREHLDRACAGDPELRAEVESLLESDRRESTPLEEFAADLLHARLDAESETGVEPLPGSIGGYRIIRKLGEGGMGVVYEAEQASPRRTVALKVIRKGSWSRALLRRFEREAEILGQLRHPGIAQVYQAGASDMVQPYFAMELIQGRPLLDYVAANGLGTRERLELMARVCDAVDHAHAKGVIHRDLKPGNILVDTAGQPKVLDFGVARLTGSDLRAATLQTSTGQILGTVPYMSPEQASGDPEALDRRTDVYSLGVILHELLTGQLPHRLEGKPLPEALRLIREEEPSRLGTFGRSFRGDLETIVAKALEKEPGRRYPAAGEVAADLRRHLADLPIVARPISTFYQLRKFARRNKALVAGAAVALAALTAGTLLSLWQAGVAIEHRRLAERKAEEALLQAYRASLAAASAAMEAGDPVTAEEQLGMIEPDRRGWAWRYWWNRNDRSVAVLDAGEPIAGASFNEDGSKVLMACESGRLRWWDSFLGDEIDSHVLDTQPVAAAAFSPGGGRLAAVVGSGRRRIGCWDTPTRRKLGEVGELDAPCHSIALSADGRWVVAAGIERAAWIWNADTSRVIRIKGSQLEAATYVRPIAFYPDAPAVLLGGNLGWLGRFDLHTGKRERERTIGTLDIHCLKFTGDGSVIALGERSNKLYLGSVETGQPIGLFLGHKSGVWGVDFSPDEKQLASAGDRTVRLWDLPSGKPAAILTGHRADVRSVAFSRDGARLLSVSLDQTVRIWDPRRGDTVSVLNVDQSYARGLALLPGGKRFLTGAWHGYLQLWDAASGDSLGSFVAGGPGEQVTRIGCVAVAGTEPSRFASGHGGGWLRVWDGSSCALIAQAQTHHSSAWTFEIAASPDGAFLASPHGDRAVGIWSVPDLALRSTSSALGESVQGLCFSPDGSRLAAGVDRTVRLLDAGSLKEIRSFHGHTGKVSCVAFNQDGSLLASGSADRTVRLWEPATARALGVLSGHTGPISDLTFAPDGPRLASGSADTSVRIWETRTGDQITHLRGHSGEVGSLQFSPDGSKLFSTAGDGTVRIWDTAPAWTRWQARHRRRRSLERVEPMVARLFSELEDPARVRQHLETDRTLSEPLREAALEAALIRTIARRGAADPKE